MKKVLLVSNKYVDLCGMRDRSISITSVLLIFFLNLHLLISFSCSKYEKEYQAKHREFLRDTELVSSPC